MLTAARTCLFVLTLLVARASQAQHTVDPVTTTGVSGFKSTSVTWLATGLGAGAIYAITWDEHSDKPCVMQAQARSLASGSAEDGGRIELCSGSGMNYSPLPENSSRTVSFTYEVRYFIRGIAVCNNNNGNHRLKGIRIYPAKVWVTQQRVDELTAKEEASHTNCASWSSAEYCPANQVASAIVVHHSDKEITGLALRCRRVDY